MILIAGGTGTLGTQVVRLLRARGLKIRILTRDPARARHLEEDDLVEVVPGDAQIFETVTGKAGKKSHVPLPMMRLMSVLMRPVNPTLARQAQAGVVMDTHDFSFDSSETSHRYPSIPPTSLADVVRRDLLG
jgi:NAD(P)-dependent dehydrogenase (short-subunit alcohol dehydrogenase family)